MLRFPSRIKPLGVPRNLSLLPALSGTFARITRCKLFLHRAAPLADDLHAPLALPAQAIDAHAVFFDVNLAASGAKKPLRDASELASPAAAPNSPLAIPDTQHLTPDTCLQQSFLPEGVISNLPRRPPTPTSPPVTRSQSFLPEGVISNSSAMAARRTL